MGRVEVHSKAEEQSPLEKEGSIAEAAGMAADRMGSWAHTVNAKMKA